MNPKVDLSLSVEEVVAAQAAVNDRIEQMTTMLILLLQSSDYHEYYSAQLVQLKAVKAKLDEQVPF